MATPITIKEYFAYPGSPFSNADAKKIGPVLHELSQEGGVTARDVVDAARSANSALHSYFEWNDKTAADEYRLEQARRIMRSISVRYIDEDGAEKSNRAFLSTKITTYENEPRRYRSFEVLNGDTAFAAQMMGAAYDDLFNWKRKYAPYVEMWERFRDQFQMVLNQIDEFVCDVPRPAASDADKALATLVAWRDEYVGKLSIWTEAHEQITYIMDAISGAEEFFKREVKRTIRDCLNCGRSFESAGPHHRICDKCGRSQKQQSGIVTREFYEPREE